MGRREAKLVVRRFFSGTSCHGVQQIESGAGLRATLWMVAVFLTCALCTCQFVSLALQIRRYEVTIVPEISDEPIPFPAVTMCNLNPYQTSKLGNVPELKALEKLTSSLTGGGLKGFGQGAKRSVRAKRSAEPAFAQCLNGDFGPSINSRFNFTGSLSAFKHCPKLHEDKGTPKVTDSGLSPPPFRLLTPQCAVIVAATKPWLFNL